MTSTAYHPRRVARKKKQKAPSFGQLFAMSLGELLIILGLLVGGYVVWQLWWTTHTVSGEVAERITEFQGAHPAADTGPEFAPERTDDPPIIGQPAYGETFGVLHVPKWNDMAIPITEGTGQEILNLGNAGHYVDTQLPGEIGNFALAGHRRTYGNNFRRVDILQPGDPLIVETADAYLIYEMESHEIVTPDRYEVVLPVPNEPGAVPEHRLMTLTTCHPEFGNSERFIVYNEFKYWTSKEDGLPRILAE